MNKYKVDCYVSPYLKRVTYRLRHVHWGLAYVLPIPCIVSDDVCTWGEPPTTEQIVEAIERHEAKLVLHRKVSRYRTRIFRAHTYRYQGADNLEFQITEEFGSKQVNTVRGCDAVDS